MIGHVILHALEDSAKVLIVLIPITFLIALLEPRLAGKVKLKGAAAPLVGVTVGLFPQCGFSVVATDLYQKRHITVGTLIGVYLATSDEALPIFLADPDKALHILPILAFKFVIGLASGYAADAIFSESRRAVAAHNLQCDHTPTVHFGCCSHSIESGGETPDYGMHPHCDETEHDCDHEHPHEKTSDERICPSEDDPTKNMTSEGGKPEVCGGAEDSSAHVLSGNGGDSDGHAHGSVPHEDPKARRKRRLSHYLVHPLVHSAKIFAYVFVVNLIFGFIIESVGEDALIEFLSANKYVAPLFAVIVGAIPNCASSVVISNLYLLGGLGFGATLGGLLMNSGLGFAVLFKDRTHLKRSFAILGAMFAISLVCAYAVSAVFSFEALPI